MSPVPSGKWTAWRTVEQANPAAGINPAPRLPVRGSLSLGQTRI